MGGGVKFEVVEMGILEIVLAAADAIEATGQAVWKDACPLGSAEQACAMEWFGLCEETAAGLRKVIARLDRGVQMHLEGACKNH